MESRWFNTVVVVIWLTAMGWLVIAKILPPLRKGEPPNYRSVLAAERSQEATVRWRILWNDRPAGFADHRVAHTPVGMTTIQSRVHFDRLPLEDLLPPLLLTQIKAALGATDSLHLDCIGQLAIDPKGRLISFSSKVRKDDVDVISLNGIADAGKIRVTAQLPLGAPLETSINLPEDALVGDELSPQAYLPGLRLGQEWTVPIFNPLRPDATMEILQASVPRDEWVIWDGQPVLAHVVEYRADAGSGLRTDKPRGTLWVDSQGMVMKQEVRIGQVALAFERLANQEQSNPGQPRLDGSP